jgi:hypothetical protein
MKANNIYDKTKVQASDKGCKHPNQQKKSLTFNSTKTDHNECDLSGVKYKPLPNQEHQGFQFGTNPMSESGFEKSLSRAEQYERESNRRKYILGIQGRDGGKKPYETGNVNNEG